MGTAVQKSVAAIIQLCLLIGWSMAKADAAGEGTTSLTPSSFIELQDYLRKRPPDVNRFRARGPFRVDVGRDYEIPVMTARSASEPASPIFPYKAPRNPSMQVLAADHIVTDLFTASHGEKAPLVVFMHGFDGSSETHFEQAIHVATWGMHALTLRLLSDSEWGTNGRIIAKLIRFLVDHPQAMNGRIDSNRIVLVGYSFGGISVSVALALDAPAVGAVLLDPAAIGDAMPEWLPRITAPVLIVGADERLVQTRNREFYFQNMGGRVAEVSVVGATHEDAQSSAAGGLTTRELQATFVSVVTSAAFSLSSTGEIDDAWASFGSALREGWLFNARKR
jgi:pimeloyl-ACP methyl ester carboxylesterase